MDVLLSLGLEHRLIRRMVDAFEAYVGFIEARLPVEEADLKRFVAFFQDFVGRHHHDKEEALLFPALVEAGLDWNGEPLSRIRSEHDQEHYLTQSLGHAAQQLEAWSEEDRRHFSSIAKTFIAFQRHHMQYENTDVYARAENILSEVARARLSHDTERHDDAARANTARFTEIADVLIRRYLLNERSSCEGPNRVDRSSAGSR